MPAAGCASVCICRPTSRCSSRAWFGPITVLITFKWSTSLIVRQATFSLHCVVLFVSGKYWIKDGLQSLSNTGCYVGSFTQVSQLTGTIRSTEYFTKGFWSDSEFGCWCSHWLAQLHSLWMITSGHGLYELLIWHLCAQSKQSCWYMLLILQLIFFNEFCVCVCAF